MSFPDLCRAIIGDAAIDGEFIIRQIRGKTAGNKYGYALQHIDVDRLNTGLNRARAGTTNAIIMGIEVDEYRRPVPPGFMLTDEETEYFEAYQHNGLTDLEQMVWRRAKVAELKDPLLFKQEYPATAAEAFQTTGHDSFIKAADVLKARKATLEGIGPLVIGVDPKREGSDRFAFAWRRGRKVLKVESDASPIMTLQAATKIKDIIDRDKPAKVFIDAGGGGGIFTPAAMGSNLPNLGIYSPPGGVPKPTTSAAGPGVTQASIGTAIVAGARAAYLALSPAAQALARRGIPWLRSNWRWLASIVGASVLQELGQWMLASGGKPARRMNVLNPRALRRSITRVRGFARFAKRAVTIEKRPYPGVRFKGKRRRAA